MDPERRPLALDAVLYAGSALFAGLAALFQAIPLQRDWGAMAVLPYAAGALVATVLLGFRRLGSRRALTIARAALCLAVFGGATLFPLAVLVSSRAAEGPATHAQSDTIITEEAARALVDGRSPYAASYVDGPLRTWPLGAKTHFPYLPGMVAFGMPRTAFGDAPWTDARVGFLIVTVAVGLAALRVMGASARSAIRALQFLLVLPTGAQYLAGAGNDLPVLALMLLSLALAARRRPVAAGVAAGVAAVIKQTAWPLLPFLALAARDAAGRRATGKTAASAAAVVLPVVVPFLLWDPGAFLDDVVRYPLGAADQPTLAQSPTLGRLLVDVLPFAGDVVAWILVAAVAAGALFLLVRRPPATASDAAIETALVLAAATLLAPAGRFGYLVYPINLIVWARWLPGRERDPRETAGRPADRAPLRSFRERQRSRSASFHPRPRRTRTRPA